MHGTRKALTYAGIILFGAIAASSVFVMTYDVNRLRPLLNDRISETLGRQFRVQGNMQLLWYGPATAGGWLHILPSPRLTAQDIQIDNPAWAAQPHFITLAAANIDLRLLPLLHKHLDIISIQLVRPQVDMERLKDGRNNWTLKPAATQNSTWKIDLGDIYFDKGTIVIRDARDHIDGRIVINSLGKAVPFDKIIQQSISPAMPTLTSSVPDYVFRFSATGHYNQAKINSAGMIGGVLPLANPNRPFPLKVEARIDDTRIALTGTLTDILHLTLLDLQVSVSGISTSQLYPLTGVTLPDSPPFSSTGHLRAQFSPAGNVFNFEHFAGRVGSSDVHGNLRYLTGTTRPRLSGNIASDLLRFADLAPLLGSQPHLDRAEQNTVPITSQPTGRVFPVSEFRTSRWQHMDADVVYTASQITLNAALPIKELDVHLLLEDGVLQLQPLHFSVAGGSLSGNIVLNGNRMPMHTQVDMQVRNMQLALMFPTIKAMQSSRGEINGDIRLDATGNSISTLAAGSNGEMKLLVDQGVVSRNLLELAGLNLPNIVVGKLFGDKLVPINCAAADLVVKNGQMDPRLFLVDTSDAQIVVTGNIDLALEKLDLDVVPHTHGLRFFSLRTPLYINGSFKNPKVGVNLRKMALKGGIAVAMGALLTPAAALLPLIAPGHRHDTKCGKLILAMPTPSVVLNPGQIAKKTSRKERP